MGGEAVIALFLFQEIEPQRRNFKVTEVMRAEKFRSSFYSWFVVIAFQTLLFILCSTYPSNTAARWGTCFHLLGEVRSVPLPPLQVLPHWGFQRPQPHACEPARPLASAFLVLLGQVCLPQGLELAPGAPLICYWATPGSLPGLNFRTTHPGSLGSDFLPRGFLATSPCALSPFSLYWLPAPPRGSGAEQSWAAPLDSMHLSTADLCFSLFMISTDAWQCFKIFSYYTQFQAFRKVEKNKETHSSFSLRNSPILISLHSSLICIFLNAIILHTSVHFPLMFLQCGMPFPALLAWLQLILRHLLQGLHPNPCLRLVVPLYVHKMSRCS